LINKLLNGPQKPAMIDKNIPITDDFSV
jgi:hypothetical protein